MNNDNEVINFCDCVFLLSCFLSVFDLCTKMGYLYP